MSTEQVDSPTSAPAPDDEHPTGAADARGDGEGRVVESSPPPAPPAPKQPADSDISERQLRALERQNEYLERIAGSTDETHRMTKELHDGILADEEEIDEPDDGGEPTVSIVEPTPPPQPSRVTDDLDGGQPANGRPAKKGWRKYY